MLPVKSMSHDTNADVDIPATDFETAIDACEFGMFNVWLILACAPAVFSTIFETTTVSYIIPVTECDLDLTLMRKGTLNAMTYAGMIVSAIPWGYIADTMGRRKVLIYGLGIHGIMVLAAAISQSPVQLMVLKFFGGFFNCGPFASVVSYLAEFHGKKHRPRIMMCIGIMLTSATLLLPIMAYLLLPHIIELTFCGLDLHTWHIFLALTSIPSFLSSFLITLFRESPKFLMSQGKNDEALKVFRSIYAINTGNNRSRFELNTLEEESPEKSAKRLAKKIENEQGISRGRKESMRAARATFIDGLKQIRPLFTKTYLGLSFVVYSIYFCILTSQNTIRLWMPQLFATLSELEQRVDACPSMCTILEHNVNKTIIDDGVYLNCYLHASANSYNNNIILATINMIGYIIAVFLINILGSNNILKITLAIACVCGSALYWSSSSLSVLIISSIFIASGGISATTMLGVSVGIFPTGMRTIVLLIMLTCGRLGSLLGNIVFPHLITHGCISTFIIVGGLMLLAFILTFLLPNTQKMALK